MKRRKLIRTSNPRLFDLLCMGVRITFPDGRVIEGNPEKEQIILFCANSPLQPCATHYLGRDNMKLALSDPLWVGI